MSLAVWPPGLWPGVVRGEGLAPGMAFTARLCDARRSGGVRPARWYLGMEGTAPAGLPQAPPMATAAFARWVRGVSSAPPGEGTGEWAAARPAGLVAGPGAWAEAPPWP